MGVKIKEVTGKEIYEAIEEDGFGALRGQWFEKSDSGKVRACLLGTAALNLGINPHDSGGLLSQLNQHILEPDNPWYDVAGSTNLGWAMIDLFDKKHDIENTIEYLVNSKLGAYTTLAELNRAREEVITENNFARDNTRSENGYFYEIPTWQDALKMAKDILTQVWDTTFKVLEYDFEADFNNYLQPEKDLDEIIDNPDYEPDYEPDEDPNYGGF